MSSGRPSVESLALPDSHWDCKDHLNAEKTVPICPMQRHPPPDYLGGGSCMFYPQAQYLILVSM